VYDSSAWLSTSRPEQAATIGGSVRVVSGSTMPSAGRRVRWAIPVLACISSRSKMATPVVSLPVPAVVGTATSGFNAPGTGRPSPIGGLT
jgi:hypothetical protein